ncbi:unnamed protein product [Mytilus coruscus]|uniref:Uncharacterized protein n=1 Tax=Mytilus coruscus TaxID=42192 RepID=A0A6J8AEI1_MYTCO|nr:unnamed protein product [Mytilus coruscus]
MLITEFPENICIENESYAITLKDPMSGLVEQERDNSDALTFTSESAIHQSLAQSENSFITLGSNLDSTIDRVAESQFEITSLINSKLRVVDSGVVGDVQASNTPVSTDYETEIPNIEHTSHEMPVDKESSFHCDNGSKNETSGNKVDEFFVSINENNVETADTRNDESFMSYNDNNDETSGTGDDERGMALRGHRDDDAGHRKNKGYFKELIQCRIEASDTTLEQHFETCSKVVTYTSNTSQNELLTCIKTYIQKYIVEEVKGQPFGGYYGI